LNGMAANAYKHLECGITWSTN